MPFCRCWNPGVGPVSVEYDSANRPALFEFGAGHCISCEEMAKVIDELKTTIGDKVEFRMIYVDKEKATVSAIRDHRSIPTQVFVNAEGKEVDRLVGPAPHQRQVLAQLERIKFIAN